MNKLREILGRVAADIRLAQQSADPKQSERLERLRLEIIDILLSQP